MAEGVLGVIELEQQRQQQSLQQAQLALQQKQAKQAAEDRQFTSDLGIINAEWVSPEDKLQIINTRIAPRLKLVGPVTMEGIAPFRSLMDTLVKRQKAGEPIDDLQGQIEYFSANPKFVAPQEMPTLVEAQGKLREGKIGQLVPEPTTPDPVKESRQRLNEFGPLLKLANEGNAADLYTAKAFALKAGLSMDAAQQVEQQYQDVTPLISQLRQDQALHQSDVLQREERDRTRQLFRSNPSMVQRAIEGKFDEMGFSPDPVKNAQMRVLEIRKKPYAQWTEQEKGYVTGWAKSIATAEQAAEVGVLTARMEAPIALADMENSRATRTVMNQAVVTDAKAQQAVRDVEAQRIELLKNVEGKTTATDKEAETLTQQAQAYATLTQVGDQAYTQAVKPQVAHYDTLMKETTKKLTALQRRLITAPAGRREGLGKDVENTRKEVAAYEASHRLLLEHNPYEIELLKSNLVQAELTKNPAAIQKTKTLIAQKETGRKQDLETVNQYQLHLMDREEKAGSRLLELEGKVKKEDAVIAAGQAVLTWRAKGDSWTHAMQQASEKFRVPMKDVVEQTDYWRKNEGELTLSQAQTEIGLMAEAWQASKGEWPDHTQTIKMANTVMKRHPGLKREDIIKGLERGSAGGGGLDSKDLQKSYGDVITLAARLSGNSGIQIGQGEGGVPEISIGSVKDPLKLAEMMETIVSSQTYLDKTVQNAIRNTIKALQKGKTPVPQPAQPTPNQPQSGPSGQSAGNVEARKQALRERYGLAGRPPARP